MLLKSKMTLKESKTKSLKTKKLKLWKDKIGFNLWLVKWLIKLKYICGRTDKNLFNYRSLLPPPTKGRKEKKNGWKKSSKNH